MGLPGKRLSRSSKRRRASQIVLKAASTTVCPNCKATILPHHACPECGMYRGRSTRSVVARTAKPATKKVAKVAKAKGKKA